MGTTGCFICHEHAWSIAWRKIEILDSLPLKRMQLNINLCCSLVLPVKVLFESFFSKICIEFDGSRIDNAANFNIYA